MKKRLLVVDDDPSVREFLKKVLEDTGYEVILAADGEEAADKLDDPKIDLLILDLNMPNRDGWDVLEDAHSDHPLMPVVIVTGMIDQLATMAIPGAAALLQKPIDVPVMLEKIKELLAETPEARRRRINRSFDTGSEGRAGGSGVAPAATPPVPTHRRRRPGE